MDAWVKKSQEYMNASYVGISGVPSVVTDGQSGWQTMFALTRALQHELGITSKSDSFGPTTLSTLTSKIGDIGEATASSHPRVFALLQCALWCKGYPGGSIFGRWDASIDSSLVNVRTNMGLAALPSVSPKMFKSLLTMDAYVVIANGSSAVRAIQQWMNHRYAGRTDYFVVPCDGIFSRDVQRGLMLAIQYEIGMDDGVANGNFGPGTQAGLKSIGLVSVGSSDSSHAFVRLFQAGLTFNGYPAPFDGSFGASTQSVVSTFQTFAELPGTDAGDYATWASLLISTGDPARAGKACDTSKTLTVARVKALKAAGYETVGRYLSVDGKRLNPGEIDTILSNGMSMFPIFQEWNNDASYFTEAGGFSQAVAAVTRARNLGFKAGTIVYFAVDYDATAEEIPALLIPYFRGVRRAFESSRLVKYRVGIYGTRNVCARVSKEGLADASFVSGMSTGYSGNLGFPLPANWSYDQVQEYSLAAGPDSFPVDKDIKSRRSEPVTSVSPTPVIGSGPTAAYDEEFFWRFGDLSYLAESLGDPLLSGLDYAQIILHRLQRPTYWGGVQWPAYTPLPELLEPEKDNPHRGKMMLARAEYEAKAGLFLAPWKSDYDLAHMAASTRGYLGWPIPPNGSGPALSDLGGWALDLVTCWRDYVDARKSGPTIDGAQTWIKNRIGGSIGTFSRADLVSDMDAYFVAQSLSENPQRPLSDVIREIVASSIIDPTWRPRTFLQKRFDGSPAKAELAAKVMLSRQWLAQFDSVAPAWLTLDGRRFPGEAPNSGDQPTSQELREELTSVARAWSEKLQELAADGL